MNAGWKGCNGGRQDSHACFERMHLADSAWSILELYETGRRFNRQNSKDV